MDGLHSLSGCPTKHCYGTAASPGLPSLQAEMALILDHLRYAMIAYDNDWRITHFNKSAEKLYGYISEEVIGRPYHEVIKPIYLNTTQAIAKEQLMRTGQADAEVQHLCKDGHRIIVDARATLLRNKHGHFIGFVGIYRDITDRTVTEAALQESQKQLEMDYVGAKALQNISTQLLDEDMHTFYEKIIDAAIQIMHSDFASIQMLYSDGGKSEELRLLAYRGFNQQAAQFWKWVDATGNSTCGVALRTGRRTIVPELAKCDFMQGTKDLAIYLQTGIRACQTTPLIARNGKIVGMMSTHWRKPHQPSERDLRFLDLLARQAADLIERKKTEDRLRESEQHHRELADALRIADQQKNAFLATLSHELRNPLAAIRSSLTVLKHTPLSAEQSQRITDIIDRQSAHLSHLVDDLLDVARITENKIKLQLELLDLNEQLKRLIEDHQAEADERRLHITLDLTEIPLMVRGDRTRLAQAFWNLMHNAIKFTPAGGSIRVSTHPDSSGGWVVAHVADTGIGIPQESISRLFKPFMQLDTDLARPHGGLGLGLSVVKGLIDLHGGEVTVYSTGRNAGTEFTVKLPLQASHNVTQPVVTPEPGRSLRILLIEDNLDLAETLSELLEIDGHLTRVAQNGSEGIAEARRFNPDVVLCDIGLPGIDGYEVAKVIRADEMLHRVFLVALTGYAQPDDLQKVFAAGFDRHLAKPADLDDIRQVMAQC